MRPTLAAFPSFEDFQLISSLVAGVDIALSERVSASIDSSRSDKPDAQPEDRGQVLLYQYA